MRSAKLFTICALCLLPTSALLKRGDPAVQRSPERTVEVLRDTWGTPHLFAAMEEDGFYGLGHVTAEDRLIQMELFRRRGRGRLAEIFGARMVESDKSFRTAGIPRYCGEAANSLPSDIKRWFEAYSAGVNAYRAANPERVSRAYSLLGVQPEPWVPGDCICAWMGATEPFDRLYNATAVRSYRDFEALASAVGEEEASRQRRQVIDDEAAVVPESEFARDAPPFTRLKSQPPIPGGWMWSLSDDLLRFSHAWAVHGTRSTTGGPILESDPQVAVSNPPFWYEFHLTAGRFDVRGIGMAGAPALLIGFNRHVAWGASALGAGATLTYIEKLSADGLSTVHEGQLQPVERTDEQIAVRAGVPIRHEVRRTRHGYAFDAGAESRPDELYVTHNPQVQSRSTSLVGLLGMMSARNWRDFQGAMAGYFSPGLHIVYADVDGNIGYQTLVYLARTRRSPKIALEGWSGLDEVRARIPLAEIPHMLNPISGFVSHANNLPVGSWYPLDLGIGTGGIGHSSRSLRLVQLLSGSNLFSPDQFQSLIHRDDINATVAALYPVAYNVAREAQDLPANVRDLLQKLQDWDLRYRSGSGAFAAATSLASTLVTAYRSSGLATRLGGGEGGLSHLGRLLSAQFAGSSRTPQDQEVRRYLLSWLSAAADDFARSGSGRGIAIHIMPYQANGPLSFPPLDPALELRSPPLSCPQVGTIWSQAGNSYTQIVDLAEVDNSRTILPPGISEDPASPFHNDQIEMWVAGATHPAPLSRNRVEKITVSHSILRITAGSAQEYGPWNRDLELHTSDDGLRFRRLGIFVERGGVPSLVRKTDGSMLAAFQWFPLDRREAFDRIAVRLSHDDGATWGAPEPITISGMAENLYRAFDPTLAILPDGRIRLYFTSERRTAQNDRGNRAIFSAISNDGIQYTFEPGERFGFATSETYDCAVAWCANAWHLYCPVPRYAGFGYHAISGDGLSFERRRDVTITGQREWLGNVLAVRDGLLFYGSGGPGAWTAFSLNGFIWTLLEQQTQLGGDPAVAVSRSGQFLALSTGPLRPDARLGPPEFK